MTATAPSTIDSNGFSVGVNSAISGAGSLTIIDSSGSGNGVVTFGGAKTYTGGTQVTGGTLAVTGTVCGSSLVHMGAGDDRVEVAKGASLGRHAEVRLGAGDDAFSGPAGKHCWTIYGGSGDDTIDWFGGKSKNHRAYA